MAWLIKRRQPMGSLLEACAELSGQSLDVIATLLNRLGKCRVRHDDRRCAIGTQSAVRQPSGIFILKGTFINRCLQLRLELQVCKLLGQMKALALCTQRLVEQDLLTVPVQPPQISCYHFGGHSPDSQRVLLLEVAESPPASERTAESRSAATSSVGK